MFFVQVRVHVPNQLSPDNTLVFGRCAPRSQVYRARSLSSISNHRSRVCSKKELDPRRNSNRRSAANNSMQNSLPHRITHEKCTVCFSILRVFLFLSLLKDISYIYYCKRINRRIQYHFTRWRTTCCIISFHHRRVSHDYAPA